MSTQRRSSRISNTIRGVQAISTSEDRVSSPSRHQGLPLEETKQVQQKIENLSCVVESTTNKTNFHSSREKSQSSQTGLTSSPKEKKKMAKRLDFSESNVSITDGKSSTDFQMQSIQNIERETCPSSTQECPGSTTEAEEPPKKRQRTSPRTKTKKEVSLLSHLLNIPEKQPITSSSLEQQQPPQSLESPESTFSKDSNALQSKSKSQIPQKPYKYHNPALSPVIHAPKSEFGDTLPLPAKYQILEDLFKLLETVMLYFKRTSKQHCTLLNLQLQIEKLSHCRFEQSHLQQILALYPEAYSIEYQQLPNPLTGKDEWQLVLSSSIEKMTNDEILNRRKHFHNLLLNKVKQQHNSFLDKLNLTPAQRKKELTEWHSEFPLEDVEDLPLAPLPQPPTTQTTKESAKEKTTTIRRQRKRRLT